MKNKVLKISVAVLLIMTLTMTNFIFLGASFVSYAADNISTNNKNIEFNTYFKDENGNKTTTLERTADMNDMSLYLAVNVNKEGFFNGEVELTNSNFTIESVNSDLASKISNSKVKINQLNTGATTEIELKIKPVEKDVMGLDLLDNESELKLTGIYRNSSEKDIKIEATRKVNLKLIENTEEKDIKNEMKIITNKVIKVSGEDKRIVQVSLDMGLNQNVYPMKKIYAKIKVPEINGKQPEVKKDITLNTMTASEYKYENGYVEITLNNDKNNDNNILWKKQGNENIILTYIYDADTKLENEEITTDEKVTLYNDKEISSSQKTVLTGEEIDTAINVETKNEEDDIYKGKLYSGIDRQYNSITELNVNLANVEEYITIKEEASKYQLSENEVDANVYYNSTTINKESFNKLFGNTGDITIYNENNEILADITNNTQTDENGNFVVDYTGREPKTLLIKTSTPVEAGKLEIKHTKTIKKSDTNSIKNASAINTKITYGYNNSEENLATYTKGIEETAEAKLGLKESTTETKFETNRNSLSTVITNNIEMKLVLKTDDESRDLYKNPIFRIELPEQIEKIEINKIDLLYEDELKIEKYQVDGRFITIKMAGEQTKYTSQSVEGANIIINAKLTANKTSVAKPENINVLYRNEKANSYANNEQLGKISKEIDIVAPKDVTAINSIKDLDVETVGEKATTDVSLERGKSSKKVGVNFQIVNNNEENINNVKIIGTFPTKTKENNIDMKVVDGIKINNGTIYYTENENATADLENQDNDWKTEITNPETVKKYLITMDKVDARTIVEGSYNVEIPENLEYNQNAKEGYEVTYTKGQTQSEKTAKATTIAMGTGVGPKIESKLTATLEGQDVKENAIVKNGEVIKYKVNVSNTGSVDVSNVKVTGIIPTGTKLVQPVENYEYSGDVYYKELDTDKYETTIDSLKVGESKDIEYEVMVKADTAAKTVMTATATVNYLDVVQNTNELKTTTQTGNLQTIVKRVTDRNTKLYENTGIRYYAIIKNISNKTIDNVKIQTNKSDNLDVVTVNVATNMGEDEDKGGSADDAENEIEKNQQAGDIQDDEQTAEETDENITAVDYSDEMNIGTIVAGETKVVIYNMVVNGNNANAATLSVTAKEGQNEYKSNIWDDQVNKFTVNMSMTTNTQSKYIKAGDTLTYNINVKNDSSSETSGLAIIDNIPSELSINKVVVDGEEVTPDNNNLEIVKQIPANTEMAVSIETLVNSSMGRTEAETITNQAIATVDEQEIAKTAEVNHVIKADVTDGTNGSSDGDNSGTDEENPSDNDGSAADGKQIISGLAWYDANQNGKKDDDEETLNNIKVRLLNVNTNQLVKNATGETLEVSTNDNGMYVLENIAKGKYIVIFDYDNSKYSLTTYKAEGVNETENSDARLNELLIGDSKESVASTDTITVGSEDISDISIGLIELKNFDLKLDKYINKISVQNSAGTTVKEYNNTTTAKIELDAKQIKGSNVIVEYNIVVTNVGEVAGYAKNIVDYMPGDLTFNSELNKDWYQKDNALYSTSISNDIINPGESKTVTLTLTKVMGEDNVVARNSAEIYKDYNDLGLDDSNSKPGNKAEGENDMGAADLIVSIRTGGVIYMTIIVVIAIVLAAGATAGIIVKKRNKKEE